MGRAHSACEAGQADDLGRLFDAEFPLNPKFFHAFAECRARDTKQLGSVDLVPIGLFESLNYQLAFDCRDDFELRIFPRPMK